MQIRAKNYSFIVIAFVVTITISIFPSNKSIETFTYSDTLTSLNEQLAFNNINDNNNRVNSSSILESNNGNILTYNTTGIVSYIGEVNVSNLQRPLFKPFTGISSEESYLTRDFAAYKAAKNESEMIKPNTRVFEIKPSSSVSGHGISFRLSLHNQQDPTTSFRTNSNNSSTALVVSKFEGLAQNCCIPPDIQIAAGTKYIVEMVNLDGAIYTKNGNLVKSFGLQFLFSPIITTNSSRKLDVITDPVLLFDSQSRRWFASISDITAHSIRIAVSKTDDPTGVWRIYNFPFGVQANNCSDQPFLGLSKDKIIVTVNNWDNDCNWNSNNQPPKFRGVQFSVAEKTDLINGTETVRSVQSQPDISYFSLHPVTALSPTTTLFIASTGAGLNHDNVQVFYIDGPLYNLHIKRKSYLVQDIHIAPDGIQPSMPFSRQQIAAAEEPKISTGDARVQSSIWYRGNLWIVFNDGCFVPDDTKSRSCIRLIQIDTITNKIIQDFDIGALASSLYYPAISIDKHNGTMGIIIGYSSRSIYPSILVTTRSYNDKLESINDPQSLRVGTANELSNRYGDYFAASSDPANNSMIWVAGEYHLTATWSTYIGQMNAATIRFRYGE